MFTTILLTRVAVSKSHRCTISTLNLLYFIYLFIYSVSVFFFFDGLLCQALGLAVGMEGKIPVLGAGGITA